MNTTTIIAIILSAIQVFAVNKSIAVNSTIKVQQNSGYPPAIGNKYMDVNNNVKMKGTNTHYLPVFGNKHREGHSTMQVKKHALSLPLNGTKYIEMDNDNARVKKNTTYMPVTVNEPVTNLNEELKKKSNTWKGTRSKTIKKKVKKNSNCMHKMHMSDNKPMASNSFDENMEKKSYYFPTTKVNYASKEYNGYTLFRAICTNQENFNFLKKIKEIYSLDFWLDSGLINTYLIILVPPAYEDVFREETDNHNIVVYKVTGNIEELIDRTSIQPYTRSNISSFNWKHFYHLRDIYGWMEDLKEKYPTILKVFSIGDSYEGKPILCAQIRHKETKRSNVIIEGGIHAREWISPAVVTYFMYKILTAHLGNDIGMITIAEMYEWFFIPVVNPDGYQYSMDSDRLWKNNRNLTGVDLDRNFDIDFGKIDVNDNPESPDYAGSNAFSEVESLALAKFIEDKSSDLEYYMSFHSFGQRILLPYGNTKEILDNYNDVYNITINAADEIRKTHGTGYIIGNSAHVRGYLVSGSSADYVKKVHRVPYVMTFELGDSGDFGFLLPSNKILPICQEILNGLRYIFKPKSQSFFLVNNGLNTDESSSDNNSQAAVTLRVGVSSKADDIKRNVQTARVDTEMEFRLCAKEDVWMDKDLKFKNWNLIFIYLSKTIVKLLQY